MNKFIKNNIIIIIINFSILFILLILLELIFGNWIFKNKINQLNIPKNVSVKYKLNDLYKFKDDEIIYSRDKWGFRGEYNNIEKIDILTIGGSTTDQKYVSDGYTFQDIIKNEFARDNQKVNIVNAGIDGQSTFGHIKNFDLWFNNIPNLDVKYYLFYIGVNDFHIKENAYFDDLYGNGININIIQKIKNQIKKNSIIYYLYRTIEGTLNAYNLGIAHNAGHTNTNKKTNEKILFSKKNFTKQQKLENYDFINERVTQYGDRIQILINRVSLLNSKAIFVTQSSRRFWDKDNGNIIGIDNMKNFKRDFTGVDYYYMSRKFNKKLKDICLKNNVMFIDLDEELDFDIEKDFYDNSHHNNIGAEKIGKFLYKKIKILFN